MPAPRKQPRASLRVELTEDDGDWSRLENAEAIIEHAADAVAAVMGRELRPGMVVSVALSSDANVAELNERFRGIAKATNVLSFPAGAGAADGHLGDIVLARETIEREADEQDVSLVHHVQHLVVHGILHLLGYDHTITADAERMEAFEIKILSELGVANPYTGALEIQLSDRACDP
jgi:probable rRNA maturation factor